MHPTAKERREKSHNVCYGKQNRNFGKPLVSEAHIGIARKKSGKHIFCASLILDTSPCTVIIVAVRAAKENVGFKIKKLGGRCRRVCAKKPKSHKSINIFVKAEKSDLGESILYFPLGKLPFISPLDRYPQNFSCTLN